MKVTQIATVQREDGDRLYALTEQGDLFYMDSNDASDGTWQYVTTPADSDIPEQIRTARAKNSFR